MPRHSTRTSWKKGHTFIDLTGKRFDRWIVLRHVTRKSERNAGRYRCEVRCDCGNVRIVESCSLRNGVSRSCGCLRNDVARRPRLPEGLSGLRRFIGNYKSGAQRRHLQWDLTEEQVQFLIQQSCHYCGKLPSQIQTLGKASKPWMSFLKYNGLDRRDNNIGYVFENVLPCCKMCNWMKGEMGYEEFLLHMKTILDHMAVSYSGIGQ